MFANLVNQVKQVIHLGVQALPMLIAHSSSCSQVEFGRGEMPC